MTRPAKSHTVFAFSRITLDHLAASLETRESHIRYGVLLVVSFISGNNGSNGGEREVDAREPQKTHK
jgi:hypothetical protein